MNRLPKLPGEFEWALEGALGHASIYGADEAELRKLNLRKITYFRGPARAEGESRTRVSVLAVYNYEPATDSERAYGRVLARNSYCTFRSLVEATRGWHTGENTYGNGAEARRLAIIFAEQQQCEGLRKEIKEKVHAARHEDKPSTKLAHVRKEMRNIDKRQRELTKERAKLVKQETKLVKKTNAA